MEEIIIQKIPELVHGYRVLVNGKDISKGAKEITIKLEAGKPCIISTHSETTFGTVIKTVVK